MATRGAVAVRNAVLGVLVLLAPCVAVNRYIEPQTGDRPVRIARWVESLETLAAVAMVGTIALVVVLAKRRGESTSSAAKMALAQGALVFVVALPMLYFSRGGAFLEGSYVQSHDGPGGRTARVYTRGSGGCGYDVYIADGWSMQMRRSLSHEMYSSNRPPPGLRWNDSGTVTLLDPQTGDELRTQRCAGLLN